MMMSIVVGMLSLLCSIEAAPKAIVAGLTKPTKPHILMVLVDDFGWADAGWHRKPSTPEVVTPTMDDLVASGVELNRHYVHMMCTPTRSSFYSGRLPIHVLTILSGPCDKNGAIPRNMTGIAHVLKRGGYATHHVGKWDAGMVTPDHTPHGRGFDTALSYFGHGNWAWSQAEWGGSQNERTQIPVPPGDHGIIDFYDTDKPASQLNGTGHEEDLFRDRIQMILQAHNQSQPLFLTYASKLVHYPLQAPKAYQEKFSFITDSDNRRTYHAMVNFLDDQLGNITGTMKSLNMWENTLMVLSSDNGGFVKNDNGGCQTMAYGGPTGEDIGHGTACYNGEAGANNWPLRGGKYSQYEGGIRVNAFASGGILPAKVRGTKLSEMIHIVDWFATFATLAGQSTYDSRGAASNLPPVDSLDMWPLLSGENGTSPRDTVLVTKTLLLHKQWKFSRGNMIESSWGGEHYPNGTTIKDNNWISNYTNVCSQKTGCLYDVVADMTEQNDVAAKHPAVVKELDILMTAIGSTIYEASHAEDPACTVAALTEYGGFYGPWLP